MVSPNIRLLTEIMSGEASKLVCIPKEWLPSYSILYACPLSMGIWTYCSSLKHWITTQRPKLVYSLYPKYLQLFLPKSPIFAGYIISHICWWCTPWYSNVSRWTFWLRSTILIHCFLWRANSWYPHEVSILSPSNYYLAHIIKQPMKHDFR